MSSVGSRRSSRARPRASACPSPARAAGSRRGRRPSGGRGRRGTRLGGLGQLGGRLDVDALHAGGLGRDTLAAISVTSAPAPRGSGGEREPMRPLERLPMKRTGSIGSRVPPAVTRTRRPSQGRSPAGQRRLDPGQQRAGSGSRPLPNSPREASCALLGLDHVDAALAQGLRGSPGSPRPRTCGRSSPARPGAGRAQARKEVVSIESAMPAASLAIVLAEAGATR